MSINLFSVQEKKVLITGATGHLGRFMALALAENGAHVYVNGRNAETVNNLVQELVESGYKAKPAVFDVNCLDQIKAFIEEHFKKEALDVLINNAYSGGAGNLLSSQKKDYVDSYSVAVVSAQNLMVECKEALIKAVEVTGDASVINIASMYGMVSPDPRVYESPETTNPPFYGAAKAALIQLTKYAASELGCEGIRVNSISPGPFPSSIVQSEQPDFIKKLEKKVPLNRIGNPVELSGPVLFLSSTASTYVNGANIVVDGGWTIR